MKAPLLLAFLAVSFLTGCATNPFTQYYQSYTNQMPVAVQQRLLPPSSPPQIITAPAVQGFRDANRQLEEEGLICIGSAAFSGGAPTQQQLVWQAKNVGADKVVFSSEFSHTEQGVRPIFSYQPGQTYTTTESGTMTANAHGSTGYAYGSGTYSGYSTTTTPGTLETQYVPYQREVYNYGATFWRHMKPSIFGAHFLPIPDSMRFILQRNTGALVDTVVQDSPAFRANILTGDVIIQVADQPVETAQGLIELLQSHAGHKVQVKLIRGTQTLDIDVQLNGIQ